MPVFYEPAVTGEESYTRQLAQPVKKITKTEGQDDRVEEITAITIRRPTTKDMLVTDGHQGEVGKTIALIAHLSDLPPKLIQALIPADFADLGAASQGF